MRGMPQGVRRSPNAEQRNMRDRDLKQRTPGAASAAHKSNPGDGVTVKATALQSSAPPQSQTVSRHSHKLCHIVSDLRIQSQSKHHSICSRTTIWQINFEN